MLPCSGEDADCNIICPEKELTSNRCSNARESVIINDQLPKLEEFVQTAKQMTFWTSQDGAAVSLAKQWKSINWDHCQAEVNRLQMRIMKAVREKRWNKVKSLQWILTHSFSAKVSIQDQIKGLPEKHISDHATATLIFT